MKKKFILPILLVVLLVIAFCYYKYSHNATWQLVEIEMTDDEILKEMRTNGELHKILVAHLGEEGTKEYEAAIEKLDIAKL